MSLPQPLKAALCLGFFSTLLGSPAHAQVFQRDTSTLHVVEPLRVPGAILEPGSYKVRVVDEQSDRNVVQITDLDGSRVYATMIATPHVAGLPRPDSEFVFYEDTDGRPVALRSWWAPNDPYGQDLYYGSEEAAEITRLAARTVPSAAHVALARKTSEPAAASSPVVPAVKRERPATVVASKTATPKMPHTASPMPLVLLGGFAALAGAATLRSLAGRSA